MNLEEALRKTEKTKKFQQKIAEDVNKQKAEVQKAFDEQEVVREAQQIVAEMKPDLFKPDKDSGLSARRVGKGGKTPVG